MSARHNRAQDLMEKNQIRAHVYQYYFSSQHDDVVNSIFAFIDPVRGKALLLDTAYPEYSERVKADLAAQNIEPEIVIISHFHPDHVAGCSVFSSCKVYASRFYADNHFNCTRWEPQYTYPHPGHLLADGDTLTFGEFGFSFSHAPGHSRCLLLVQINRELLHVSDLLMFNRDGKPCLPYIAMGGSFKEHIASLNRIKTMECQAMIMSHGHPLIGAAEIAAQVEHRLYYLEKLLQSNGSIALAACLKEKYSHYANHEFHDNNLLHLMEELD